MEIEQHEPNTARPSRVRSPRPTKGRLFVIFLDTYQFLDVAGSHRLQRTLHQFPASRGWARRHVCRDDAGDVGAGSQLRASYRYDRGLPVEVHWFWGQRGRLYPDDPVEQSYVPVLSGQQCFIRNYLSVPREMIQRRHERQVLGALRDLSVYLGGVREERKAVITMTGGWVLFRENPSLTKGGGRGNVPRGRHDAGRPARQRRSQAHRRLLNARLRGRSPAPRDAR